ncbi:F0F1 ATP synthase subunit gamma [Gryllotalpicola protaetiae]|uniref:ATP synthase gamma chain n=1 Tax=Gryllotalpicola protaetiae TaxID=2419771 RepID=A0A387BNY9_9MICO|nr:F0F1 ATP synthase subunit gamma [Gryllotalpicola protaetiae]AYG04428.1 F0F1 ATP synthase subunit gamma [Gryllotalpicola protaetiae]
MGAQLRIYRSKIRSAQTTKKITRAMELISASRIAKSLARVNEAAPYTEELSKAVALVAHRSNVQHPLTTEPEQIGRSLIVVYTSDRGLAGAFNSQVIRQAMQLETLLTEQGKEVVYFLVGRKAVGYFAFRRREYLESWTGETDQPTFELAKEISDKQIELFTRPESEGGVSEIHGVFNRFVSSITQVPTVRRLLPLEIEGKLEDETLPDADGVPPLYEFEPDAQTVLDQLLPAYVESRVFYALLHSAASKHAATQKAMKSASDNADKLITNYTRLANNARQAEITQQISEIVGGADALAS